MTQTKSKRKIHPMPQISEYFDKSFLEREGADLGTVLLSLEKSKQKFLSTLEGVPDEALQLSPAEHKWSPAQVADHVIRANFFFLEALELALERTKNPTLPIPTAPKGQLSSEGKPMAPEEEAPRAGRSRSELVTDLERSVGELEYLGPPLEAAGQLDKLARELHFFAPMTALELLRLASWHMRHHARQLSS